MTNVFVRCDHMTLLMCHEGVDRRPLPSHEPVAPSFSKGREWNWPVIVDALSRGDLDEYAAVVALKNIRNLDARLEGDVAVKCVIRGDILTVRLAT